MSGGEDEEVEGFDETDTIEDDDIVVLVDDEGNESECVMLAVIEHEGTDYAALAPVEQVCDGEAEEMEVYLLEYGEDDDGNEWFAAIDDDARYEAVRAIYASLMESAEDDA